jgi:ribosomal protein S27E
MINYSLFFMTSKPQKSKNEKKGYFLKIKC